MQINRKVMKKLFFAVMAALGLLASCEKDVHIRVACCFAWKPMPVHRRRGVGETAEIRCTLVREGEYADARYTIRYFQPDGKGELRMDDGTVFLPNDRYPLERFSFRLYYTSRSDDQQTIDVYIEDNMGQVVQKSFTFQNDIDTGGEEQ